MTHDWISTSAPTRIDYTGGPTDCNPYRTVEGGLVTSAALASRATVWVRLVDQQPGLTLTSIDLGTSLVIQDLRSDPIAPEFSLAVSAVRQVGFDISITGLEIQTHVPTPRGSGLGSSGALAVALIRALRELAGAPVVEGDDLARQATTTENDLAGNTCGGQDQLVAAYGGFISLNFQAEEVQCRRLSVDTSNDIVAAMQDRSLLCHTGHSHTSGGIQETTSSLHGWQPADSCVASQNEGTCLPDC